MVYLKGKNVVFMVFHQEGEDDVIFNSISGEKKLHNRAPIPKVAQTERKFTTIASTDGNTISYDIEAKILEHFANQYQEPDKTVGELYLYSERPFCVSCQGVIEQFRAFYPKVTFLPDYE